MSKTKKPKAPTLAEANYDLETPWVAVIRWDDGMVCTWPEPTKQEAQETIDYFRNHNGFLAATIFRLRVVRP